MSEAAAGPFEAEGSARHFRNRMKGIAVQSSWRDIRCRLTKHIPWEMDLDLRCDRRSSGHQAETTNSVIMPVERWGMW